MKKAEIIEVLKGKGYDVFDKLTHKDIKNILYFTPGTRNWKKAIVNYLTKTNLLQDDEYETISDADFPVFITERYNFDVNYYDYPKPIRKKTESVKGDIDNKADEVQRQDNKEVTEEPNKIKALSPKRKEVFYELLNIIHDIKMKKITCNANTLKEVIKLHNVFYQRNDSVGCSACASTAYSSARKLYKKYSYLLDD